MPVPELNKIWLYRIVHIDNLKYLLEHGMFNKSHANADPNYINIGDSTLIQQRNEYNVAINPPNGQLGEYVPFYFGCLSPMLLNITTGHRGVIKRPQNEIIYLICSVQQIIDSCELWCFTDGHAKNAITTFYNDIVSLNQVDLNLARNRYWTNTDEDFDKMRKKQAEFLVKNHVPPNCISNIVVYNDEVNTKVSNLVVGAGLKIKIHTKNDFYY